MKRYCYIAFLLIAFLAACRKDTSVDVTVMPEKTTTGAHTFGCLVDGWIYVGGRYFDYDKKSINFVYSGNKMDVEVKVKGINTPYPYLAFTIINLDNEQDCQFIDARWSDHTSNSIDLGSGKVVITRFDANIISGTFSSDQRSGNRITHGQFDVKY